MAYRQICFVKFAQSVRPRPETARYARTMLTNPYALLVLTSGLVCAALAIYVWGRRPRRGAA